LHKFILVLTAFFLINFAPADGCGYVVLGESYRIALLNPFIIGQDYAPLFYSADLLNTLRNAKAGTDRLRNVAAWAEELGPNVSPEDMMTILYGTSLQDWLKAKKGNAPKSWEENPAWRAIIRRPDLQEYVFYAKGYEKKNVVVRWWDEKEEPSVAISEEAYRENYHARALAGYTKAPKGSFLKERYAYQLLLLAYYDDDSEAMKTYFMRHFNGETGALADWARFHFANQWNEEGRFTVEMANALRAVPEKAIAVYLRTADRINPSDYIAATRNAAERSNLYALAALKQKGKALTYLRKAYELDPSNPLVELLIVREINKLEDWLMTNPLTGLGPAMASYQMPNWSKDYQWQVEQLRRENAGKDLAYLKQLRQFLNIYRPQDAKLGAIFRGQVALLDEDYLAALKETASLNEGNEGAGLQIRIIRYLALLQAGELDRAEVKEELAKHLLALDVILPRRDREEYDYSPEKDYNLLPALNRVASQHYAAAGDTAMAFMLHNRSLALVNGDTWSSEGYRMIDYLDRDISAKTIDAIIMIMEQNRGNSAFNTLVKTTRLPTKNDLYNLAGTLSLRKNNLPAAAAYFSNIIPSSPGPDAREMLSSPLTNMLGGWNEKKIASKELLVRQLIELEGLSNEGGDEGAAACLTLAQAWYNMSNFGDAWYMLSFGKSIREPSAPIAWPGGYSHAAVPHNRVDYNLIHLASRSEEYFNCAEATAKDEQLKAKIDLSRRILKYRIVERKALGTGWGWLKEEERASLNTEYRNIMSPFVQNYGDTDYAIRVSMQCSSLAGVK
jgi:hypothetical protein